jgi:hypothetical protein
MPSTGFSLIKNYKPLAPIRKSDQLIPSDSANPAAQSDNSESSTSDKNEAEKDKNGRVELTFLDYLGEMLRPRQLKSHVEGSENDFVLSAKLHELEARTFQKKILVIGILFL